METPRIPRGVREGWDKERNFRMYMSDREVRRDRPRCRMEDKCLDPTLERAPEQRLVPRVHVCHFLHLRDIVPRKSIFKNLRYCSRIYVYHHLRILRLFEEIHAILGSDRSNLFGSMEAIKQLSMTILNEIEFE